MTYLSLAEYSRKYDIPLTTLHHRLKKNRIKESTLKREQQTIISIKDTGDIFQNMQKPGRPPNDTNGNAGEETTDTPSTT